jgi:hypothetical protein
MSLLTKADIFKADDLPSKIVDVPEWGGQVKVRACMASERDEYEDSMYTTEVQPDGQVTTVKNFTNAKARLVVKCVIDEEGKRVFDDIEAVHVGKKVAGAVNRIFTVIQDLSGWSKAGQKAIEKNLGAGQNESSPSNSPAT